MFKISKNAIDCLLEFLKYFLKILGTAFQSEKLVEVGAEIPMSLKALYKTLDVKDSFINYVVCPSCHSIYEFDDCISYGVNQSKVSKHCSHIAYPHHPRPSYRRVCNTVLLKRVRTKSGYCLQAKVTYPYMPLKTSVGKIVARKNILDSCEKWRTRCEKMPSGYLGDIYDGNVWKFFHSDDGNNFLQSPYCLLLALNVDWFEPFERGIYAVGAIYLTILNLPRSIRYKPENIILVGIIPGPKEPKHTINSYLTPLVYELQEAWADGFRLPTWYQNIITVKLALACIACDIPATRKACGFLSHNATLGCNKCLKKFNTSFGERTDYSGFDRQKLDFAYCSTSPSVCGGY